MTEDEVAHIVSLRSQGLKYEVIAKRTGRNKCTVATLCSEFRKKKEQEIQNGEVDQQRA